MAKFFMKGVMKDNSFSTPVIDSKKVESILIGDIYAEEQVRRYFDEEYIGDLSESIKEKGLQNPIHVIKVGEDNYKILQGECRFRACKKANLEKIDCIVHKDDVDETQRIAIQMVENIHRKNLCAIEIAKGFSSLCEKGVSQEELSKSVGVSKSLVSQYMAIFKLPEDWIKKIEEEKPKTSLKDLYRIAKEKDKRKRTILYNSLFNEEVVEVEEAPMKSKTSSYSNGQLDTAWLIIKKKVEEDRGFLEKLLSSKKIQKLLEENEIN